MKRDEAKQLADNAIEDLRRSLEAGHSDTLVNYLTVMSKFHNYSWNNCILIGVQRPDASHVAGFHRWLQLGRRVRKGEKGIGIMAPLARRKQAESTDSESDRKTMIFGFKVVHVFDISQTDGDDLPDFARITGEPGAMLCRLESLIRAEGITLTDESLPLGTYGVSRQGEIVISSALDASERFAVLVHEWAHERMHDTHRRKGHKQNRSRNRSRGRGLCCMSRTWPGLLDAQFGLHPSLSRNVGDAGGITSVDSAHRYGVDRIASHRTIHSATVSAGRKSCCERTEWRLADSMM